MSYTRNGSSFDHCYRQVIIWINLASPQDPIEADTYDTNQDQDLDPDQENHTGTGFEDQQQSSVPRGMKREREDETDAQAYGPSVGAADSAASLGPPPLSEAPAGKVDGPGELSASAPDVSAPSVPTAAGDEDPPMDDQERETALEQV